MIMVKEFLSALTLYTIPAFLVWRTWGKTIRWHALLLLLFATAAYAIWRSNSPYPYPLNWDLYEHQTVINEIKAGHWALLPSQLSDTFRFDGYTTLFHTAIAATQKLWNPDILGFWWFAEFFHLLSAIAAAYVLTWVVTKNRITALLAGLFSAFFFESAIVFAPLFLMPQTAAAVLWIFGLAYLINQEKHKEILLDMTIISGVLFLLHGIIGAAGIAIYFVYFVINKVLDRHPNLFVPMLIGIPIVIISTIAGIAKIFPLTEINFGEAGYFTQSAIQKLDVMRSWYGFLPLVLLPLGLELAWDNRRGRLITILFAAVISVILSTVPYTLKFYVLGRYLTIILMAWGTNSLINRIKNNGWRFLSLSILIGSVLIIFIANTADWKHWLTVRGIASYVSTDDLSAIDFFKTMYPHAFIISDPATQYIIEGLAGVDSQGGAYMNEASRNSLLTALTAANAATVINNLNLISDAVKPLNSATKLLIVSGRTMRWLAAPESYKQNIWFNLWQPTALSMRDEIAINNMETILGTTPIYSNNSLAIFLLTPVK